MLLCGNLSATQQVPAPSMALPSVCQFQPEQETFTESSAGIFGVGAGQSMHGINVGGLGIGAGGTLQAIIGGLGAGSGSNLNGFTLEDWEPVPVATR